jgi:predicted N-formylglutamate amidohydrolase
MANADSAPISKSLVSPGDPEAVIFNNSGARSPFLLVGDHAGRAIPRRLGDLGLAHGDLTRHIAWDIGVAGLGLRLAAALDACFIRQAYSRLVIDCNRRPESQESIPLAADGSPVAGNAGLTAAQRTARVDEIFRPYHEAIAAELDLRRRAAAATVLIALHSFTPSLQGVPRPWRFGVLHRGDSAFSRRVLEALGRELGGEAGDNQPYAMDDTDYTVPAHAAGRDIDYLELEVRQNLIGDELGQDRVCARLAPMLAASWAAHIAEGTPKDEAY